MLKIYVCSPLRGNIARNLTRAKKYAKKIIKEGHIPIVPHLFFASILDDRIPKQRTQGLEMGLEMLKGCDSIRVYGEYISEGMKEEIKLAEQIGIPIIYKKG